MKALEVAQQYMDCFFGDKPLQDIRYLLADDLLFKGPFCEFTSARDYLAALEKDPPRAVNYRIIHSFEQAKSVCLIYEFSKPGITTTMAQIYEISGDKISKITLIFDGEAFS